MRQNWVNIDLKALFFSTLLFICGTSVSQEIIQSGHNFAGMLTLQESNSTIVKVSDHEYEMIFERDSRGAEAKLKISNIGITYYLDDFNQQILKIYTQDIEQALLDPYAIILDHQNDTIKLYNHDENGTSNISFYKGNPLFELATDYSVWFMGRNLKHHIIVENRNEVGLFPRVQLKTSDAIEKQDSSFMLFTDGVSGYINHQKMVLNSSLNVGSSSSAFEFLWNDFSGDEQPFNVSSETIPLKDAEENTHNVFFGPRSDLFYFDNQGNKNNIVGNDNTEISFWDDIERKYGVSVEGEYHVEREKALSSFLKKITGHENFVKSLKKIKLLKNFKHDHIAGKAYPFSNGKISLTYEAGFEAFIHEIAHLWTFKLTGPVLSLSSFARKWKKLNQYKYNQMAFENHNGGYYWVKDKRRSSDNEFGPRYGFTSAYGSKNFYEDVAEFTRLLWTDIDVFEYLLDELHPYSAVYREKVKLLLNRGFCTQEQRDILLLMLE